MKNNKNKNLDEEVSNLIDNSNFSTDKYEQFQYVLKKKGEMNRGTLIDEPKAYIFVGIVIDTNGLIKPPESSEILQT